MIRLRNLLLGSAFQQLRSGLFIRQDISAAVRPVFFQTDMEEFLYATHGGTLFLVQYLDRTYGITCGHVFQDFPKGRLFITQEKNATKGSKPAPVKGVCYPSSPRDGAVDTDIQDLCVIEFADDLAAGFFKGSAYVLNEKTVATSKVGHELFVPGVLKDKTVFDPPDIRMGYCRLLLRDVAPATSDPVLRTAFGEFAEAEVERVTGISGSPVFDNTANALCGMVVRGGMDGRKCTLHYMDIFDIMKFLEGVSAHAERTYYVKQVEASRVR